MHKLTYFIYIKQLIFAALFTIASFSAQSITILTIPGEFQPPGIIGTFSDSAQFSWIKHRFPGNNGYFSWNFGGGTDDGIIFDQSQAYTEMTDTFIMFNQPTGFYSVNTGLSIGSDNTIDMSNLLMSHGGGTIDVGSGSGYDNLVPYFNDFSLLSSDQNGWSVDNSGIYHLFYNTRGTCLDCEMTIHLYGSAIVPVPAAVWLFSSGLFALAALVRVRRR